MPQICADRYADDRKLTVGNFVQLYKIEFPVIFYRTDAEGDW